MSDREAEPRGASASPAVPEPLGWWETRVCPSAAPADAGAATLLLFALSSRGDRVPGRLRIPTGSGPFPLILLAHDGSRAARELDADPVAASCLAAGAAVARLELPLHGERTSPKLSERLLQALASGPGGSAATDDRDPNGPILVAEFDRQSTSDLARALDGLLARADLDAGRVAFIGVGAGARAGAALLDVDDRPRAWVLAGDVIPGREAAATGRPVLVGNRDLSRAALGRFLAEALDIEPAPFVA